MVRVERSLIPVSLIDYTITGQYAHKNIRNKNNKTFIYVPKEFIKCGSFCLK